MITIPQNRIIKSKGYENFGDIYNSFGLDLSSNLGSIRATRIIQNTSIGLNLENIPIAFVFFNNIYMMLQDGSVWYGGTQPSDDFNDNEGEPSDGHWVTSYSDMIIFNGYVYISGHDKLSKSSSDGKTFAEVGSSLTTSTPHLMEVFKNRLYITDNYKTVVSINTSDTLVAVGSAYALDLNLGSEWTITTIKKSGDLLYIGCLNTLNGSGRVYTWDGSALDAKSSYELQAGVMAGCVLDNVHYIIDAQGVIKKYAGNSYVEVARIPKQNPNFFKGVNTKTNSRFIHPNGMQTTDDGKILILIDNSIENIGNDDSVPAGIWEYDKDIGLYHKYAISNTNDLGQTRLYNVGALYTGKTSSPSSTDGGLIICGADILTTSSNSTHTSGIFYDDSLDTVAKYGSFTSTKLFTDNIQDEWQKIYAIYKKFTNSLSKIVVKYRTEDFELTEATITWTDIDRFTTTDDISSYVAGDDVQILQGRGSGQSSTIKSISVDSGTYTVILEDNYPVVVIGYTAKANLGKWIKAGTVTSLDERQFKELIVSSKRTSPFIQLKVSLFFYGKDELQRLEIISNKNI